MTTANTLFLEMRYELNDMQKLHFSDKHMLVVLNTVLSLINTVLSKEPNININVKSTTLTLTNGEIDLPNDFERLIKLEDSNGDDIEPADYSIYENKLHSDKYDTIKMRYKYAISRLASDTDNLPTPTNLDEYVKKYTLFLLTGDKNYFELTALIARDLVSLYTGREMSYHELTPPYVI